MFVSGTKVVLFDPQAAFVPNINPANPGKMIDVTSQQGKKLVESLPNVFEPLKCFGSSLTRDFDGTIFRFALRTSEQAATSKLSRQSHSLEAMRSLLNQLKTEAASFLLFLKNVETIEIHDWPASASLPLLRHSSSILTSAALRRQRSFVLNASLQKTPQTNDYVMEIVCTDHAASTTTKATWLVCNQLGGGQVRRMLSLVACSLCPSSVHLLRSTLPRRALTRAKIAQRPPPTTKTKFVDTFFLAPRAFFTSGHEDGERPRIVPHEANSLVRSCRSTVLPSLRATAFRLRLLLPSPAG